MVKTKFLSMCLSRPIAWLTFLCIVLLPGSVNAQVKFIPNKGQWKDSFLYQADVSGGRLFLTNNELRYSFLDKKAMVYYHKHPSADGIIINGHSVFITLLDAMPKPQCIPADPFTEKYNFFLTHTSEGWRSGLSAYNTVTYNSIYPNINMELRGDDEALKYTYTVNPGGNPANIRLKISGASDLSLGNGDLYIYTSMGNMVEKAPFAYQYIGKKQVKVPCSFQLKGDIVSFKFPKGYDTNYPLIIDPTVIFATYSGSYSDNFGFTGTYDSSGHGYSGGTVYGPQFPVTAGAFQAKYEGGKTINGRIGDVARDVGILKYSPDGTKLLWATYLGGTGNEQPHSMVVDSENHVIVFGSTYSKDFPVTKNAYDTLFNGLVDIYITKFSTDGDKILASTYIGGSGYDGLNGLILTGYRNSSPLGYNYGDQFRGEVVVDSSNNIYVASTTYSSDFPVTSGAYRTGFSGKTDGCVMKLNGDLSKLLWCTYVGGAKYDACYSLQIDKKENVFVCGGTQSTGLFSDTTIYQNSFQGDTADGFIVHLSADGKKLIKGTYVGTSKYDQTYFIQLDAAENVYVYGQTRSKSYPVVNARYSNPGSGQFIMKMDNALKGITYSTVFGSGKGIPDLSPTAFLVDNCEKVYVSGWGGNVNEYPLGNGGYSKYMAITPDAFQKNSADSSDFYVAVFARDLDTILYGSYFGGKNAEEHVDGGTSRFDKKGIMYQSVCGGCGGNSDFPTTTGAWSRTNNSVNCNNLLFKVDLLTTDIKADFVVPPYGCDTHRFTFTNKSILAKTFTWDFGDGTTSTDKNPTHTFPSTKSTLYKIRLVAHNVSSCKVNDTISKTIFVYAQAQSAFDDTHKSCSRSINGIFTGIGTDYSWSFGDGAHAKGVNVSHVYSKNGVYTITVVADSGTSCADTSSKEISIQSPTAGFTYTLDTCQPIARFTNTSKYEQSYYWLFDDKDTSTKKDPSENFRTTGKHYLYMVAINKDGCTDTLRDTITILDRAVPSFSYLQDTCSGYVRFTNNSTGKNTYLWLFGDASTSNTRNPVHTYKTKDSASFQVRLIINPGGSCADTARKKIVFPQKPRALFALQKDSCTQEVKLNYLTKGIDSFIFTFGDGQISKEPNPSHTYEKKGDYDITLVINPHSACSDTLSQKVHIKVDGKLEATIPNVFSPNGDGLNDEFIVENLYGCKTYEIEIYNRWGQLVYHSKGNEIHWDGNTSSGAHYVEGIYYYVFTNYDQKERHGSVTLVR